MLLCYFLLANQKSFADQSQHYNLLLLHLQDNIFYCLFFAYHSQILKKCYLLYENLVQLNDLNLVFCRDNCGFGRHLFPLTILLKPDSNCCNNLALS